MKYETAERLQKQLDYVTEQIIEKIKPDRIILFGSFSKGEAGLTSDIDIIVVKDSEKPFKSRMYEIYDAIDRTEDVDMLYYTNSEIEEMKTKSSFIRKALAEGKIIYEA